MTHPLAGPRSKLQRAEENINNLDRVVADFHNSGGSRFSIVKQHQNNGLEYAFIAFGESEPPPRFAVMAGEIIHHLRSSLDQVVHALIVHNGGIATRKSQFPICSTPKAFEEACSRGMIKGVSNSAEKCIRDTQPFTNSTPEDTVLYVVAELDNIDKHRLLVKLASAVSLGENITIGTDPQIAANTSRTGIAPVIVGFGDPAPRKLTRDGVVVFSIRLAEPAPELVAEAQFVPDMAFEKCGRVEVAPVIQTLRGLLAGTQHTVELFAGEFSACNG